MPRSKRNKQVSLTQVKKGGQDKKDMLIENVREAVEKYQNCVIVEFTHQRNVHMKEVRERFKPGKLFYGKNKLMQVALGSKPENEVEENIRDVSKHLVGTRGLLFTDEPTEKVQEYCTEFCPSDFARNGTIATELVKLPKGEETFENFSHSIEEHLRSLGLPTQLKHGKIILLGEHTVCKPGQELTTDQSQILKLLNIKMSRFEMLPIGVWEKKLHAYKHLAEDNTTDDEEMSADMES